MRDALLGKAVEDYDFATSATPGEVQTLFQRVIPTGIKHGTVSVRFEDHLFEVTTYRVDGVYSDNRHPDSVTFTRSLREDLARRDFTINAIALEPESGALVDPFEGRNDLKRGVIRTVGPPEERFKEDALRMVRGVRFLATLDFSMDPHVSDAIPYLAHLLNGIAAERVGRELEKLMGARQPSLGWDAMRTTGILEQIIPELLEGTGPDAPLFAHLIRTCDCTPRDNPVLRWAGLLHDVGKPRCRGEDARGTHFHRHDSVSADIAREILTRLRFSNQQIQAITHLIQHHMFGYTSDWSDAAVRRFVARVGASHVSLLFALRRADGCGKTGTAPVAPDLDELESRVRTLLQGAPPLSRGDLAVGGKDLMQALELKPGPLVGIILDELLQTVLDDPSLNHRETLLEIAHRFQNERLTIR